MEEQNIVTPPPTAGVVTQTTTSSTSTPPTPPVEAVETPKKSSSILVSILAILLILALGSTVYLAYQNMQLTKQVGGYKTTATPLTYASPTPVATTTTDPTANWTEFKGTTFLYANTVYTGYSFKYPSTCIQRGTDTIFDCTTTNGTYVLTANAGGHGGEVDQTTVLRSNEDKNITAGEGKWSEIQSLTKNLIYGTYWLNKTDKLTQEPIFGFEFTNVPVADRAEFDTQFDQILSTLKFN